MKFQDIIKSPSECLSMTGLILDEFYALMPYFIIALSEAKYTLERKERKNKSTNYKNSALPTRNDQLLFILVYCKQYPTQSFMAMSFGMTQPKVNQWIHFLSPILDEALSKAGVKPCEEMGKIPEKKSDLYIHDGVERRIQRPKDKKEQKKHYSGKKKDHTVKNNVLVNENCEIVYVTPTVEGKKHDKKLADEFPYVLPSASWLLQDTGYQGFYLPNVNIIQPKKKPRGGELTQEEKDLNREISTIRVRVEHVMSGIKRCRIVKDRCRNWMKGFKNRVMQIACGLHNFRLKLRPWAKIELTKTLKDAYS